MEAAPVQIVKVEPTAAKKGTRTSEFGTMVSADVVGIAAAVTDVLPLAYRWIPMALSFLVKAAYVISRGVAKKPPAVVVPPR